MRLILKQIEREFEVDVRCLAVRKLFGRFTPHHWRDAAPALTREFDPKRVGAFSPAWSLSPEPLELGGPLSFPTGAGDVRGSPGPSGCARDREFALAVGRERLERRKNRLAVARSPPRIGVQAHSGSEANPPTAAGRVRIFAA
jgi:hypothetical protein